VQIDQCTAHANSLCLIWLAILAPYSGPVDRPVDRQAGQIGHADQMYMLQAILLLSKSCAGEVYSIGHAVRRDMLGLPFASQVTGPALFLPLEEHMA
jgi:hypothetical protein